MFCPKCGSPRKDFLFCGMCQFGCRNCGAGMNCKDTWNRKIIEDSKPIWNPIKAIVLIIKHKYKLGKREDGG